MTDKDIVKNYSVNFQNYTPQCPIIIPSYKNRPGTILNNLSSLSNNKIILFIYDTDYINYKQYENNQIEIVQIHEQWRSIQKKRHWIQNYLANNRPEIENYLMIDDDINKAKISLIKDDGKITSKYIPLINALGILEDVHKKYSNTISGGSNTNTGILSGTLVRNTYFYRTYCINNKWVKNNPNCMFRDLENVAEDTVIWYDCYNNQQQYYAFDFLFFEYKDQKSGKYSSISSTPINIAKNMINGLRIMKINCQINWSKEWNCWSVRFIPKYNESLWPQLKEILDTNMPDWEDINKTFSNQTFITTFDLINKKVEPIVNKKAIVSTLTDFFM